MKSHLLAIIGQIASGKSTLSQRLAAATGATVVAIDDLRNSGATFSPEAIVRSLKPASAEWRILECSGTRDDFEELMTRLEREGEIPFVVKLTCSLQTAADRLRGRQPWRPPRYGALWEPELRWVERRLRSVPANETILTDALTPDQISEIVLERWKREARREAQMPHGTFSFSELASFARCPLAYRFRFVDGCKSSYESFPAFLGTAVHAALSWLYGQRECGNPPALPDLHRYFRSIVEARTESTDPLRDPVIRAGEAMLATFHSNVFSIDRMSTLAIEKRFELELDAGLWFRGSIDRLALAASGMPVVIDYKTSAYAEPTSDAVPDLLQLDTYAITALLWTRADVVSVRRHHVPSSAEERHDVAPPQVARIRAAIRRWIQMVAGCVEFEPHPSRDCRWCAYNRLCPVPLIPQESGIQPLSTLR